MQTTTGRKAESLSGLSLSDAFSSVSLRQNVSKINTYQENIKQVGPRLDVMDTLLNRVADIARKVRADNLIYNQSDRPPLEIIQTQAKQALSEIQNIMNSNVNGRYLFGGDVIDKPPFVDADALKASVQAHLDDYFTDTVTGADALTSIKALSGTDLGQDPDLATAGPVTARIDDNLAIEYGVRADSEGFNNILKSLSIIAGIDYDRTADPIGPKNDQFFTLFNGALDMLETGARAVDVDVAQLGETRGLLDRTTTTHDDTTLIFQKFIGSAEDVDTAEAISRLQTLQTQLQVAYQTIGTLQRLNLIDFLR